MSLCSAKFKIATVGALLFLAAPARAQAPLGYHVTQKLPLPGEGGWDYLTFDEAHRRLFVTRVGGVSVFNAVGPDLVPAGQVPGTPGILVNRAVLVEGSDFGFTSNGLGASTTIFRLHDLGVYGVFPLGISTDAAVYDDATRQAVFFSTAGREALIYDLSEQEIVARIPLGSAPEFAVDDHRGSIYVNLPDKGEVAEISVPLRKIVRKFPVSAACHANSSIDIDAIDRLLFVGCFSGVMDIIDSESGAVVSTFPIGPFGDAVVYDPGLHVVFVSTVDAKITAIRVDSPTHQTLLGAAVTEPFTHTMAIDLRTHRLFTDAASAGPPTDAIPLGPVIPGTFNVLTLGR